MILLFLARLCGTGPSWARSPSSTSWASPWARSTPTAAATPSTTGEISTTARPSWRTSLKGRRRQAPRSRSGGCQEVEKSVSKLKHEKIAHQIHFSVLQVEGQVWRRFATLLYYLPGHNGRCCSARQLARKQWPNWYLWLTLPYCWYGGLLSPFETLFSTSWRNLPSALPTTLQISFWVCVHRSAISVSHSPPLQPTGEVFRWDSYTLW